MSRDRYKRGPVKPGTHGAAEHVASVRAQMKADEQERVNVATYGRQWFARLCIKPAALIVETFRAAMPKDEFAALASAFTDAAQAERAKHLPERCGD